MTNESNIANSTLQIWWEEVEFPGKEYCSLNGNGELTLIALQKPRVLATLTQDNADITVKALVEKYPDVAMKVEELKKEWEDTEDKLKLTGKLSRCEDYLLHASAIGDFDTLFSQVKEMEAVVTNISEANYQLRLSIIQKAEEAADSENIKQTSQLFKELTEEWKKAGFTDKTRSDELWSRMEAAKNKFFDHKRQQQETDEKDMLENLDLKLELVDKAESLALSEAYKETSDIFRIMMEEWRKIGKIPHDKNEELWNRFIKSKNTFFDRKRLHFEFIQQEQEQNYSIKLAIVEQAEAIKENQNWTETTQQYSSLMDQWKATGKVPSAKSDELWDRFSKAKDHFFQAKRNHTETIKVAFEDNYAQKMALLKRAEAIKTSTQWRETTEEMNDLMAEWKKIGPVPREHSDRIWKEFLDARTYFFDKKDQNRERRKQYQDKQKHNRTEQTRNFLQTLEQELEEEESKLADFNDSYENVTPGPKEKELQKHLQNLIQQTSQKVKHKKAKIDEVRQQLQELESKEAERE